MKSGSLFIDIRVGEHIEIGPAKITLHDKTGRLARVQVEAPKDIPVNLIKRPRIYGKEKF